MDQVSTTLLVMQNMMLKKGMFDETNSGQQGGHTPQYDDKNKGKTKAGKLDPVSVNETGSNTTIYQNVLQQVARSGEETKETEPGFINAEIRDKDDPEIVLNIKLPGTERRESTSSEDKIDTSDELMEVDCDKFIADCRAEAMRNDQKIAGPNAPSEQPEQYNEYPSEKIIREAESARARAFKPAGNSPILNSMRQTLNQSAHHLVMD